MKIKMPSFKFPTIESVPLQNILDRFFPLECKHKWEIERTIRVFDPSADHEIDLPKYNLYVMQCKHCGEIKEQRVG